MAKSGTAKRSNAVSQNQKKQGGPTEHAYPALSAAYDYLNKRFFGGRWELTDTSPLSVSKAATVGSGMRSP